MPGHLTTLLLTLFALLAGAESNTATGDTGSGLEPNG
jgi:hypothetical protein